MPEQSSKTVCWHETAVISSCGSIILPSFSLWLNSSSSEEGLFFFFSHSQKSNFASVLKGKILPESLCKFLLFEARATGSLCAWHRYKVLLPKHQWRDTKIQACIFAVSATEWDTSPEEQSPPRIKTETSCWCICLLSSVLPLPGSVAAPPVQAGPAAGPPAGHPHADALGHHPGSVAVHQNQQAAGLPRQGVHQLRQVLPAGNSCLDTVAL